MIDLTKEEAAVLLCKLDSNLKCEDCIMAKQNCADPEDQLIVKLKTYIEKVEE